MRGMRVWITMAAVAASAGAGRAATLRVPGEYPTIQDAIDAARYGDTVLVSPGVYTDSRTRRVGDLGDICANVFLKSGVDVAGSGPGTRIEANSEGAGAFACAVLAYGVEDASFRNFTVTGHQHEDPHYQYWGRGLWAVESELTVEQNIFDCFIPPGGCQYFSCCAMFTASASLFRRNIVFYGEDCAVASLDGDETLFVNDVIFGDVDCVGLSVERGAVPEVYNNIFAGLWEGVSAVQCPVAPRVAFNCFWNVEEPFAGFTPGGGNIFEDPLFTGNPVGNNFNFHLTPDSPCIDAGIPAGMPYYVAPDIGRYEFCPYPITAVAR